jgi:sugar/nucleoside kinase (ribokinase family)
VPRLIIAGNANVDLVLGPVAPWPSVGTETLVDHAQWRIGGALGNTAIALSGMGVPADVVYDVGDDAMGSWLSAELGGHVQRLPAPTSVTVAMTHPDGERTFLSHLGHLATSSPATAERLVEEAAAGDVLFVGGSFMLPRWRLELRRLFGRARARGLVTGLDTGWPTEGWSQTVRDELHAVLAEVDVFIPNLAEARGLLGAADLAPEAALDALTAIVPGRVAIKLGPAGAAFRSGGQTLLAPAPDLAVADTVGAGDTFNAVLLAALRDDVPWPDAVALAVRGASHAVAASPRRYLRWADLRRDAPALALDGAALR